MEKIAYVHRNPHVAGLPYTPAGYRWSSANLPFSDHSFIEDTGKPLQELSVYERRKHLDTRIALPEDWIILPDSLIWPGSYTDFSRIERVFGSIGKYLFSLNQKVESEVNQEMLSGNASLPDSEILKMAKDLAFKLFAVEDPELLSGPQRLELCRMLRKRAWANSKQLARIFRIPQQALKEIFG